MLTVEPVSGRDRLGALTLLYCRLPRGEREAQLASMLDSVQRGAVSLDGLFGAWCKGVLVGTLFCMRQPGRVAFLWPPVIDLGPVAGESATVDLPCGMKLVTDQLFEAACRYLDKHQVLLTQCVLAPRDEVTAEMLAAHGFPFVAELEFLQRSLLEPLPLAGPGVLTSEPFDESRLDEFARLIEETSRESCDCPELNGVRTGAEALEAHRSAGEFAASRWRLFRWQGEPVGVLLLADEPELQMWDVVYMGVAPRFRGRGFGREMLLAGLQQGRAAGRQGMRLVVDRRNTFALNIYRQLGFVPCDVKRVHLRIVGRGNEVPAKLESHD